ncbi:hypothetical protein [Microlunatus parietis]|uniref:Uncharacterized protein n=1 Tax=Microlunatus parietis TaxID=682979 RepID=A0A7Y9LGB4_9ACTN|nr:hypothetical protein [Microlunatus parietis]NYE74986.1 hypothetical protein [Microlunatus parietis]
MSKPRVALVITTWFPNSHADVIARHLFRGPRDVVRGSEAEEKNVVGWSRLITGYELDGPHREPRVEVVSAYLEQQGVTRPEPRPDVGTDFLAEHGVPIFPTVAEAITLGGTGVAVDGVVLIGEHGDYEDNEFGQKLYPRRRLFDAAVAAMITGGRTIPIFVDKHLSYAFTDARSMYDDARRLGIPLLAGSSVPLAYREPTGADWRFGAPLTDCLVIGYGGAEVYGFHALEAGQALLERRAGGETGVVAVQAWTGPEVGRLATDPAGPLPPELITAAAGAGGFDDAQNLIEQATDVYLVEHADGDRLTVLMTDAVTDFLVAARGPDDALAYRIALLGEQPYFFPHFARLVFQIEQLMIDRRAPYPVERTLLTGGVIDGLMRSRAGAGRLKTPDLAIAYRGPEKIEGSAVAVPLPKS